MCWLGIHGQDDGSPKASLPPDSDLALDGCNYVPRGTCGGAEGGRPDGSGRIGGWLASRIFALKTLAECSTWNVTRSGLDPAAPDPLEPERSTWNASELAGRSSLNRQPERSPRPRSVPRGTDQVHPRCSDPDEERYPPQSPRYPGSLEQNSARDGSASERPATKKGRDAMRLAPHPLGRRPSPFQRVVSTAAQ